MENSTPDPAVAPVTKSTLKDRLPTWEWVVVLTLYIALLGIGVSYWWVQQITQISAPQAVSLVPAPAVRALFLEVTNPNPDNVALGDLLTVEGQTLPNIPVVFYTETQASEAESDASGHFSGTILLDPGINSLVVTAVTEDGEEKTLALDVVLDNQVLGENTEKQSVARGLIKKLTSDELTPLVDNETVVVNAKNKPVKLSIIKRGDKALVLITDATGAGKRRAAKVFVQSATDSGKLASKRRAVQGVIQTISGSIITLAHQIKTNRQFVITIGPGTLYKIKGIANPTLADLKVGDRIVAVADNSSGDVWLAKTIFVTPGRAKGIVRPSATPTELATPSATPETATPTP